MWAHQMAMAPTSPVSESVDPMALVRSSVARKLVGSECSPQAASGITAKLKQVASELGDIVEGLRQATVRSARGNLLVEAHRPSAGSVPPSSGLERRGDV